MKLKILLSLVFIFNILVSNGQVTITWVEKTVTDTTELGASFSYIISYPQVQGCKAERKINKWLVSNCELWSKYDYKNSEESAFATMTVEKNTNGLLIFERNSGFENAEKARERKYYLKFNTKTGATKYKNGDDIIDNWLEKY